MPSAWIEHVKKYASENGVSYRQAMKDSKATYVSVAKPKAPPKPRGRQRKTIEREEMGMEDIRSQQKTKPKAPKGPPKPRGRPKKEREQMGMEDFDAPAPPKKSRKRRPKMKPYADLAGDAEAEFDENDPVNFMSVKKQRELEPIPEAPFKQPPTLVLPKPYIGKLKPNPYLERSVKTQRAKQMKRRSMRQLEVDKFKDVIKSLEDPILEKQKRRAVALSEAYTMGEEDRLSAQEREYVRAKKLPVPVSALELIEVKKQKRLKRYQKESEKILEKARKEKELAKIVASYGVPKTRQQIIEDRANDWSSEF